MAVVGHSSVHKPQPLHKDLLMMMPFRSSPAPTPAGFYTNTTANTACPQPLNLRLGLMLSGLWHHEQLSEHPLKNTVVLMPGPSSVDIRIISRIVPRVSLFVLCSIIGNFLKIFVTDTLYHFILKLSSHCPTVFQSTTMFTSSS